MFKGTTINHMARLQPDRTFLGFDSFRGLPEKWAGHGGGTQFDRGGKPPRVRTNVKLIEGWFDDTLPSSGPRLVKGAVLAFDKFFNYAGYKLHEHKAFFDFVDRNKADYRFIAYSGQQVSVRIGANG